MKKLKISTLCLSLFLAVPLFSAQEGSVLSKEAAQNKIYINMDTVSFDENKITFSNSHGMQCGTHALRCDDNGFFVLLEDEYWICPYCAHQNPGEQRCGTKCAGCGKPERC